MVHRDGAFLLPPAPNVLCSLKDEVKLISGKFVDSGFCCSQDKRMFWIYGSGTQRKIWAT